MNLEPVAQLHDQSLASRKTCRKPPWLAIASDQHHFGIVSSPHAAGGAVSGQVAPTDLSGAQTQIHASAIRSAETRGGTKTGMAAHQILAIAKGKDQLTAVPQSAPQRPDKSDIVGRSLFDAPDELSAERATKGQRPVARTEQPAGAAQFAGFPAPVTTGTIPFAAPGAVAGNTLARPSEPDQIAGQTLPFSGPPPGAGTMVAQGVLPQGSTSPSTVGIQIAEAMRQSDQRVVQLQLAPAELGRVRITLAMSEFGLQVIIASERPDTLELLRRNASDLIRELEALGYEGLSLDFGSDGHHPERQHETPGTLAISDLALEPGTLISRTILHDSGEKTGMDLRV